MNRIRDKRLWWAANYGRAHVPVPLTPMVGIGFGVGLVGMILMVMAFMVMASPVVSGVSLAFVTFASLPGRNVNGIKELRQVRGELKKKAIALIATADGRDYTAEEQTQYDALKADIARAETLIQREEDRLELERETAGAAFDRRQTSGAQIHDRSEDDPSGGFGKDHRGFLQAVMDYTTGRRIDSRLERFKATQGSDEQGVYSDPHGGFLLPITVMPGVLSVSAEQDPLASLVTSIPMETETIKFNARVDKNHSSSVSGGLTVTRRPETVDGSPSRMQFEPIQMTAHELFGLAFASERILEASPGSFIALLTAGFGDEFAANKINERINGSGTGEFAGVLKADCLVTISKETNQTAASIITENIDKMAARCWRYGSSVYLANHNTRPQLKGLSRAVGTGGSVVPYFMTNPDGRETLDGRPIFFSEFAKTVGTKGDLILGNWSQYVEGTYHPLRQAESIHVRFVANERAFRFWLMNDGQPWWKSALTPKNGDTLSPFVVLETRS